MRKRKTTTSVSYVVVVKLSKLLGGFGGGFRGFIGRALVIKGVILVIHTWNVAMKSSVSVSVCAAIGT